MKNYNDEEIKCLLERFEDHKLPKSEWTHEAHLIVAVCYATKYNFEEALSKLRTNIIFHNESAGTPNTDTEGYHETITKFWLLTVINFLKRKKYASISQACNDLIKSEEGKSDYPLTFYSKEILFTAHARHSWVHPDLKDFSKGTKNDHLLGTNFVL